MATTISSLESSSFILETSFSTVVNLIYPVANQIFAPIHRFLSFKMTIFSLTKQLAETPEDSYARR
jgi:hypothetical protein